MWDSVALNGTAPSHRRAARGSIERHRRKRCRRCASWSLAPKAAARAEKERQQALFFDAPGGALPPLQWHNSEDLPSDETLEFTSRLIERKLADFGVR
jgi:hypothetical protein